MKQAGGNPGRTQSHAGRRISNRFVKRAAAVTARCDATLLGYDILGKILEDGELWGPSEPMKHTCLCYRLCYRAQRLSLRRIRRFTPLRQFSWASWRCSRA